MAKTKVQTAQDVAVTEALTLLMTCRVSDYDTLNAAIEVAGHDLDQFAIKARNHPSATLQTLYSAAGSFTSPTGLITAASGDLTTQAAATQGMFVMDVRGFYEIKIYAASGNVAGSTVDIYAGLK